MFRQVEDPSRFKNASLLDGVYYTYPDTYVGFAKPVTKSDEQVSLPDAIFLVIQCSPIVFRAIVSQQKSQGSISSSKMQVSGVQVIAYLVWFRCQTSGMGRKSQE